MEARALEHERRLAESHGQEALKHAIAAAEIYMRAAEKAANPKDRNRLQRKCSDLIALGERLKANAKSAATSARSPVPESTRTLTIAEKTLLLKSSKLHGNIFPPWEKTPASDEFAASKAADGCYTDHSPFTLSPEQQDIFAGWKRPHEIFMDVPERGADVFMTATESIDLGQDLATDCSVVASLCAAVRQFGPRTGSLLSSLMYPYDDDVKRPAVSQNGKYIFRMYFNGCWRKVLIDDRLPTSSSERTLYVVDRRNPYLIWPALIEKAYLKIRGGYDFPGSNSGTDLHALTGWIPEQIFLQTDDIELNETWSRIKTAYEQGNALVTLGTGKLSREEERTLGLVREHDYAVLDLRNDGNNRLFLVKNPWRDSLVWTGVGSTATSSTDRNGSPEESMSNTFWMTFEDVLQHFDSLYVNWSPSLFRFRQDHHFTWTIPPKAEELVFTQNPQYSILSHTGSPVWVLLNRHWQDSELDILRERKQEHDFHRPLKSLGYMSLSLFASHPPGSRIPLSEGSHHALHQGPYVDSPNTLLRYSPTPGVAQTLVIAQSDLPLPSYSFTLSFFSNSPLTISPASDPLPYNETITGAWTRRTAGGSTVYPSYVTNPQYALTLTRPSPLSLVLSTERADNLPVHIAVLYSNGGQRVTAVVGRDLICSSAEYQRGCTFASTLPSSNTSNVTSSVASMHNHRHTSSSLMDPGTYTIVLSTYEPGQTGRYSLRVSAACPFTIEPILSDAAGRLRTPAPSPATFRQGEGRVRARVDVARLTRASVLARSVKTGSTTQKTAMVRVALELGTIEGRKRVLASTASGGGGELAASLSNLSLSERLGGIGGIGAGHIHGGPGTTEGDGYSAKGEFADASLGLRTREVDLDPDVIRVYGGLWLVVEQIGGGGQGHVTEGSDDDGGGGGGGSGGDGVHVEISSDGVVNIGEWEVANED
ncbi:calpain-like protease [Neurospora intermedia]|uniref:Calpain-like protease n=1 Tax=Neurospora intermedia TaxID=5142 RepID=A0ABR3DKP0_NEUIN